MKSSILALCLLLSTSVFAFSKFGEEVPLQYDMKKMKSLQTMKIFSRNSQKLQIKIEDVSFPSKTDLDKKQREKFLLALRMLNPVLNSVEFKQKVLSYVRPGHSEPGYQKNYLWRDSDDRLSPEAVYNILMKADERMVPNSHGVMNVNAWVKKCKWPQTWGIWCRKVIGSTSPSSSKMMKLNWKFYKRYDTHQMVSNIVHEWIHLLGFLHGKEDMREEVPYVVGAIAGEVAKNMLSRMNN